MFNGEGKRLKKFKTNGLAKLEEFLKDFPFGDENKPCHAELLPLEDNKKAENYLTCAGKDREAFRTLVESLVQMTTFIS